MMCVWLRICHVEKRWMSHSFKADKIVFIELKMFKNYVFYIKCIAIFVSFWCWSECIKVIGGIN